MHRVFVEKKPPFAHEARHLLHDFRESLALTALENVRVIQRYEIDGVSDEVFAAAVTGILSEPQVDLVSDSLEVAANERAFAVEYLPGQFDQRADSATQCIQIISGAERPGVRSAQIVILRGTISDEDFSRVKKHAINTVDSHEVPVTGDSIRAKPRVPADVKILTGFSAMNSADIRSRHGLAMSAADVAFCQQYFRDEEKRDPSITEIKMLDTYWSDHCRHTTFLTKIDDVTFDDPNGPEARAYRDYLNVREKLGRSDKPVTLMDIALIGMRELKGSGELDNLEVSDEVNAASIVVPVEITNPQSAIRNPQSEEWLVMFKNETHNHPTEIEPFGGAATCLGGCIRDPLSGRSFVYQAMRVTGAGDPLTPFTDTLPGKLPQKKICQVAAHGYSSYGNQIGLATGQVAEVYHPGYVAKRLEIGAVVAAAPRSQVFRGKPSPGDVILLIGGRTGRDGVGGATGSSKEHTDTALENSAEVQKGDAPTERKIQRLFRNPELTRKIKICNDFGAGGVSVAIGEIAPSLVIDLDAVPKKYDGLDGTELAISESQERMAVCIDPADAAYFIAESDKENLECVKVADVTDSGRLVMKWRGKTIVDLSRDFLDTNGVQQSAQVHVSASLTPVVNSSHEPRPNPFERRSQNGLRESADSPEERSADVLRRVHCANEKTGEPLPTTLDGWSKLHRALRTVEEREIRSRLNSEFLDHGDFENQWLAAGSLGGAEHRVCPALDGRTFIKANDGVYHSHWLQFFERLAYHRLLFPDTAYTFLGFIDGETGINAVVSQPSARAWRDEEDNPVGATRQQVESYMTSIGAYRYRNDDYYLPAEDILIEDLHDENVLLGTDGETLRFIDPVIYRRPPGHAIPAPSSVGVPPTSSSSTLLSQLSTLNVASQRGLGEMFDGSVGAGTVLWPFGGKNQITPPDAMVAKLPLLAGDTDTATFMSWGFDPYVSSASPFRGAVFAVTESVCKIVAAGARLSDIRLTLQEYFPKLGNDPKRWGLPFAALLGAFHAQHELRLAAIGGKDSMSGSFNDLDVPPTLVSFALAPGKASLALSPEFKNAGSRISVITVPLDAEQLPDFSALKQTAHALVALNAAGKILSLHHIGAPGIAAAVAKSCFGNGIGAEISTVLDPAAAAWFTFLIEHPEELPAALGAQTIGKTTDAPTLVINGTSHALADLRAAWESTLEPVYPTKTADCGPQIADCGLHTGASIRSATRYPKSTIKPSVLISAFPGTNSEYDTAKAFRNAGADATVAVFRNLTPRHIDESMVALANHIRASQILVFPGGFSAGDEPDGSAKFIATIIRNPRVADAIMDLLNHRDGLILGICNGFQALVKTGLVPFGEIRESAPGAPTLVHNSIGRHISRYTQTRVTSTLSPWLALTQPGDTHTIPFSHGEGRFFASDEVIAKLAASGQIATQYVDESGQPTMDIAFNPNGSACAVEGITSPCGRVFGKMGHTERSGSHVAKNIPGNKHQPLFEAGVRYFS
ncbi:MAG: phosphoribosylformylglycinamidine synthase subunit PurQ [Verrucomicrobiota bacterium]